MLPNVLFPPIFGFIHVPLLVLYIHRFFFAFASGIATASVLAAWNDSASGGRSIVSKVRFFCFSLRNECLAVDFVDGTGCEA